MKIAKSVIPIFALAVAISCSTSAGEIYKWKDAQGLTHYSSTPPPAIRKEEAKTVKIRKTPQSSLTFRGEEADFSAIDNEIKKQQQAVSQKGEKPSSNTKSFPEKFVTKDGIKNTIAFRKELKEKLKHSKQLQNLK